MELPVRRVTLSEGGVDLAQQIATIGGRIVPLTTKECAVLGYLAAHSGEVVTREQLITDVWGCPPGASAEPVYSTIKRLRAKIDIGQFRHIHAAHGEGYRFEPVPASAAVARDPSLPPRPLDRFVGREDVISTAHAHLEAGARLVTLVGAGGVGKTRLATELARRWRETAGPPTTWCDLTDATDEVQVLRAVAAALGVRLEGAEPAEWRTGLAGALAAGPDRILILDNAEQVVAETALAAAAWMPAARLLVTSRERLRIPGEHVVAVAPLPLEDAVTLFEDRAAAAGATEFDPEVVKALVERLDRLPLALELGASQAGLLGPVALLGGLDSTLETLSSPRRATPTRHGTLRAAIDASWNLLAPEERAALAQLSVFEGGFTVAAVTEVVVADGLRGIAIIARLAECSVLRGTPAGRFELYQAARELAAERLPDAEAVERRHANWCAAEGERLLAALSGAGRTEAVRSLHAEYANLNAACRRMLGCDGDLAARLALALDRALGLLASTGRVRREVLAVARRGVVGPRWEAALLLAEGRQDPDGDALLLRSASISASLGDPRAEAEAWLAVGRRRSQGSNLPEAVVALERARVLAEATGDPALLGRVHAGLGEVWWTYGHIDRALPLLDLGLLAHRTAGDRAAEASTAAILCHVHRLLGRDEEARQSLAEAEVAARDLGDPAETARVQVERSLFLTRTGDPVGGATAMAAAAGIYDQLGLFRERALLHLHLCESHLCVGNLDDAEQSARIAVTKLRALGGDVAVSVALEALGCVHLLRDRRREARACFEEGITLARATGAAQSEGTLLGKRGLVRMADREFAAAWDDFEQSRALHELRGAPTMAGGSLADRGMAALALGRAGDADVDFQQAWELVGRPTSRDHAGRMLALCRIAGAAWGAGEDDAMRSRVRGKNVAEALLATIPAAQHDVALRLGEWVVRVATR